MTVTAHPDEKSAKVGLILHAALRYDLFVWILTLGRERQFREKLAGLAALSPGERVLDVGCGTGSLAIAAKRRVGPEGTVYGIDASPEMIARASHKARKAGLSVTFTEAAAQTMPFPDAHFDAVLSTVMLHHLSRKGREECAVEMRRVLKPGGRVLAVDFGASEHEGGLLGHIHARHGHVSLADLITTLNSAGLHCIANGAVGIRGLNYVLATPACCA